MKTGKEHKTLFQNGYGVCARDLGMALGAVLRSPVRVFGGVVLTLNVFLVLLRQLHLRFEKLVHG